MKHIKLFENFVFEALGGLVTSKYDLDDFLDAMDKSVNDIYSSGNVKNKEATFFLAKDGNLNNLTHENIIKCIISFNGDDQEFYPARYIQNQKIYDYNRIEIYLPNEKSSYKKILLTYTFIHEFSHSVDPSFDVPHYQNKIENRRSDKIARKKGYSNFASIFRDKTVYFEDIMKAYSSDETEREAYPDGIAYIVRGLLSKNPGKKEALKDLIRINDWHLEKVFPELDQLMNRSLKFIYDYSQYYRDKLIRRISELVINDLPTNLKKIAFASIYTNKLSSATIKLLDPNNFKELLTRSLYNEASIIKYHQNFEEIVGNGLKVSPYYLYPLFKVKVEGKFEEWVCICFFDFRRKQLKFKDKNLNWVGSGSDRFFKDEIIVQTFTKEDRDRIPHYMNKSQWPESYPAPSVMDIGSISVNPKYRSKFPLGVYNNAIINLGSEGELGKPMYKILSVEE